MIFFDFSLSTLPLPFSHNVGRITKCSLYEKKMKFKDMKIEDAQVKTKKFHFIA